MRDLTKDLDALDTPEDDGLDHVGLKEFNSDNWWMVQQRAIVT